MSDATERQGRDRRSWVVEQRRAGRTWAAIGADLGVSRERARQIANPKGDTIRERYGPGPFVCSDCGKSYVYPGGLNCHRRSGCTPARNDEEV